MGSCPTETAQKKVLQLQTREHDGPCSGWCTVASNAAYIRARVSFNSSLLALGVVFYPRPHKRACTVRVQYLTYIQIVTSFVCKNSSMRLNTNEQAAEMLHKISFHKQPVGDKRQSSTQLNWTILLLGAGPTDLFIQLIIFEIMSKVEFKVIMHRASVITLHFLITLPLILLPPSRG